MRNPDLPLFTWKPRSCVVMPFPQARRIGKARKYAATAYRLEDEPRRLASYRVRVRNELIRMLVEGGVDEITAAAEAVAFDLIIDREIERLRVMDRLGLLDDTQLGPSGAA
ncbi:hypothetical protein HHL25_02920 [Rhizobium sp. S-51]|uniref:Uncharacterized protein n=1 Tax=Rhizobium terricola TaxID=2728849 RepID=A0A7Y0AT73_9HYPH|nr:DUF6074 family protein [Rhizobium terricola]NML73071.1 hypothetical protein [Rhizobium terricola]